MSGYEFQHWADMIAKFGFSLIALIGLGFFVWHIWKWVTNTVNPALGDCGGSLGKLKKQVQDMQDSIQQAHSELQSAEHTVDDLESYASSCRENISDCKVTVNDLDDELEVLKLNFDNLEGFDVDKFKREAFQEIGDALRDLVSQHIDKIVAQAVSAYEETTETDNQ